MRIRYWAQVHVKLACLPEFEAVFCVKKLQFWRSNNDLAHETGDIAKAEIARSILQGASRATLGSMLLWVELKLFFTLGTVWSNVFFSPLAMYDWTCFFSPLAMYDQTCFFFTLGTVWSNEFFFHSCPKMHQFSCFIDIFFTYILLSFIECV